MSVLLPFMFHGLYVVNHVFEKCWTMTFRFREFINCDMSNSTETEMNSISYDDFAKVHMRVGKIIKVENFPKARRPAYKLWIDFGTYGVKCSSAQITVHYKPEDLLNRLIVGVTNFPRKQIADFFSEVLVLGASQQDGSIVLLSVDHEVPLGSQIS